MSLEVVSVAAANLAHEQPAIAEHAKPESPGNLDPSLSAGAAITTGIELATQLAGETIPELLIQADSGDQAAVTELERRANQAQLELAGSTQSSDISGLHGSASPHEAGKGDQIDQTA
jgi:hypothetical protein